MNYQSRWWLKKTVAVVTGANQGIGFALVKKLAELGLTVVLTSRDINKENVAVELLKSQQLHVKFCQLDPSSITTFASWLHKNLEGLDILANNAGACFNVIGTNSVERAETVIRTNFYGSKRLTEALMLLFCRFASKSRMLNISSRLGLINKLRNHDLKKLLQDEERMSEERIHEFVAQFLDQVTRWGWREGG